ncbi:MAG: carboxylate-amine ligase [Ilumatobacter sp.]|uniref:carboxylate-amine ligase n=1 Tax=Ilumatobacter sp. TaxID=1967498 RepID=UPI0026281184|nr:carboxylate-amine ligase [Ilumatobacter sp.]MDJ0767881.1 carboxylate-amine ligase [Ilumatobacter sp.]
MHAEPSFTVGIEEEYLLVDRETRDLVAEPPAELIERGATETDGLMTTEFLQSQLEVGTTKCASVPKAAAEIRALRRTLSDLAGEYGYAIVAASTHPFGDWTAQRFTKRERYDKLAQDHGVIARRMLICGMHVHVGIDDDDLRIDLMEQATYFLPHVLALSTSSPFWHGYPTGLRSYRLSIFDGMPRTGLPEVFDSWAEYQRHVGVLVAAGQIEDASKIWWDLRPSGRFPTLEMRIADVCTTAAHAASLAALFQSVLAMLWQLRRDNQRWRNYSIGLIQENRWRAQRYGIDEGLIDFGIGEVVPCAQLVEELVEMLAPAARRLDCFDELLGVRSIMTDGTSAHRQMAVYEECLADGADQQEAVRRVVDFLIDETVNF